jgi:ABC-type multidrug transport system fused ATPase/permease subunit
MPITQIAAQMNLLQSGLASAERVFEFLDAPEEQAERAAARGPRRLLHPDPARRLRHAAGRGSLQHLRRPAAAADDRARLPG